MTQDASQTTTVHVMRHGEVHNPDKVLYGRLPDFHLSERGRRQAQSAADWLARNDIVYVVASPLERAQETAAPIAESHGLDIDTDPDLVESWNHFEGERVAPGDGALRDPRNWPRLRNPRTPSWGEPYVEVAARMKAALHRARLMAAGHEAVCVSHQLPVETLRRAMTDRSLPHLPLPHSRLCNLASVTSFTFTGDTMTRWGYSEPWGL
jgi:broad specificity phosphatase PhoE